MRGRTLFMAVLLVAFGTFIANAGANSISISKFETALANLYHDDSRLNRNGAYALGELGDHRAVGPLVSRLKNKDRHLRRIAASALGKIGDKNAVMPLIEILCNLKEDVQVQLATVKALGRLGDYRATRILAHMAGQKESLLQIEASLALKKLSPALYAAYTAK